MDRAVGDLHPDVSERQELKVLRPTDGSSRPDGAWANRADDRATSDDRRIREPDRVRIT